MARARKDGSISDGQKQLLTKAAEHGGILERRIGALWTAEGVPSIVTGGPPVWSYPQSMVTRLIAAGYLEPIEMYDHGNPPYPLKVRTTEMASRIIS